MKIEIHNLPCMALLATILLSGVSGCASITQGTSQALVFNIEPKEARCVATRIDDGQIGVLTQEQNVLVVSKDKDDIVVQCNADNYKPKALIIKSKASDAGIAGAIFIDLGITDMITGAMWQYPQEHSVSLEKEHSQEAESEKELAATGLGKEVVQPTDARPAEEQIQEDTVQKSGASDDPFPSPDNPITHGWDWRY